MSSLFCIFVPQSFPLGDLLNPLRCHPESPPASSRIPLGDLLNPSGVILSEAKDL